MIKIYNTQTKQKEEFHSIEDRKVKMYVCGPTVYDLLHVGNFRGAIFFNLVRNWFEYRGYEVTYVYNYTDIDDKIIKRANEESIKTEDVAEKYIAEFEKDFQNLGLKPHSHNPRATHHIDGMVEMIEKLIENEKAYVTEGGEVFYSVESFSEYGKLSHKNLDELQSGARVEVTANKKNPLDFVLWKPSKPNEPKWPSPWGEGRPGWHIECSVMSSKILGDTIDIHGGGIDLIFPHHENEIAQSEGSSGKSFVKYWMHNNFINFGDEKMSKSLGNTVTGRAFIEKYHPEIFKFMILMAHYRSQSDFSVNQVNNAVAGLARIYSSLVLASEALAASDVQRGEIPKKFVTLLQGAKKATEQALDDDFNTPEVFARVFETIRAFNSRFRPGQKVTPEIKAMAGGFRDFMKFVGEQMSLMREEPKSFLVSLDSMLLDHKGLKREDIDQLVEQRVQARLEKNFEESDRLRDELTAMGIEIHDTPEGTVWEVQK